mgnify:FL=1
MKHGGTKLLILLLTVAIAWQLGTLAASLRSKMQEAQALDQSITAVQNDIAALTRQIDASKAPTAEADALRRLGYVFPEDLIFFDGG